MCTVPVCNEISIVLSSSYGAWLFFGCLFLFAKYTAQGQNEEEVRRTGPKKLRYPRKAGFIARQNPKPDHVRVLLKIHYGACCCTCIIGAVGGFN